MVTRRSPSAAVPPMALLALTLCMAVAMSCSSCGKKAEPRADHGGRDEGTGPLSIESTVWQFGSIKRGETTTRTFSINNESDGPLSISVRSSCDCLTAEVDNKTLEAGASTGLRLTFLGETIKEKTTKTIYIEVFEGLIGYRVRENSPAQRLTMTVTGEVKKGDGPHLYTLPTMLLVKKTGETNETALLSVTNRGTADLEVTEVRGFGCFADRYAFVLRPDEELEMEVMVEDEWPEELRWLEIDSNDPVDATRKIPVVITE